MTDADVVVTSELTQVEVLLSGVEIVTLSSVAPIEVIITPADPVVEVYVEGIQGASAEQFFHEGPTPPADTTKIWIKTP